MRRQTVKLILTIERFDYNGGHGHYLRDCSLAT
jgi:hypothetical protein